MEQSIIKIILILIPGCISLACIIGFGIMGGKILKENIELRELLIKSLQEQIDRISKKSN